MNTLKNGQRKPELKKCRLAHGPVHLRGFIPGVRGGDIHAFKTVGAYGRKDNPGIRKRHGQNEAGSGERAAGY